MSSAIFIMRSPENIFHSSLITTFSKKWSFIFAFICMSWLLLKLNSFSYHLDFLFFAFSILNPFWDVFLSFYILLGILFGIQFINFVRISILNLSRNMHGAVLHLFRSLLGPALYFLN